MSGAGFSARAAASAPPTTVFFGTIPDKYTMLLPFYSFNNGSTRGTKFVSTNAPATNINTWVQWDDNWADSGGSHVTASIGSTTTAPDGTSTAYHVTEGTNTGYHVMVAGTDDNQLLVPARRRFAVFAKAAERTRCWIQIGEYLGLTGQNNQYEAGVRCVFDLAGGQIGVPVAANNTGPIPWNFAAVGSGMIPFGNGWYLCYIDVSLATNAVSPVTSSGCLQAIVGPDSGSGTGAISNSYAGNGSSGIYVWKTNMLPPRAYGMNNVSYFSDFTSISEIDINNTIAPGFKWYVAGATWPGITYFNWPVIPPGTLTVSSSVMTVPGGNIAPGSVAPNVTSAAYNASAPNGYVGFAAAPPFVLEWKGHFDYGTRNANNSDELAWWMEPIEYIINPANNNITGSTYQEIDTVDSGVAGAFYTPVGALIDTSKSNGTLGNTVDDFQFVPQQGFPAWVSSFVYSTGLTAAFGGQIYQSLINSNSGNRPDLTLGTDWQVYSPSSVEPTNANANMWDPNQDHVWTYIRIPDQSQYAPFDDTGIMMFFFDSIYCLAPVGSLPAQRPYGSMVPLRINTNNSVSQTRDASHWMFILGSGSARNIYADYVRVTQ